MNYPIQGVDISHHQHLVNFEQLKTKQRFVYIKASLVKQHADPLFPHNWMAAKRAGITRGAYHFMYNAQSAEVQADIFCNAVGQLEVGDLPPVLDIEIEGPTIQKMQTWLSLVESRLGMKPIIYCNSYYYTEHNFAQHFPDYKFWIARYSTTHEPSQNWTFWQHTKHGESIGINGNVDLDYFRGTETEFEELLKK